MLMEDGMITDEIRDKLMQWRIEILKAKKTELISFLFTRATTKGEFCWILSLNEPHNRVVIVVHAETVHNDRALHLFEPQVSLS